LDRKRRIIGKLKQAEQTYPRCILLMNLQDKRSWSTVLPARTSILCCCLQVCQGDQLGL